MPSKPDGGPAFPRPETAINPSHNTKNPGSAGMSLRAWLAGQALVELVREYTHSDAAKECVLYADALIAELEKSC